METKGCTTGRATLITAREAGKSRCKYQRATSGKASSWSVSPVGAQSTIRVSYLPSALCWRICIREAISSIPGGEASSSATMSSTPWEENSELR